MKVHLYLGYYLEYLTKENFKIRVKTLCENSFDNIDTIPVTTNPEKVTCGTCLILQPQPSHIDQIKKALKEKCHLCNRKTTLKSDKTLRRHGANKQNSYTHCPGSGLKPKTTEHLNNTIIFLDSTSTLIHYGKHESLCGSNSKKRTKNKAEVTCNYCLKITTIRKNITLFVVNQKV